jgi:hypothetical protein
MYIHKYKIGDEVFFRVTKTAARPSKNVTITFDEWKGYSSGSAVQNTLKFLNSLSFSKDEAEETPGAKGPVEEKPIKKSSLASLIRLFVEGPKA